MTLEKNSEFGWEDKIGKIIQKIEQNYYIKNLKW